MKKVLLIGLAGSAGALLRAGIGELVKSESGFPLATLLVNIVGTFLLCFLVSGVLRKLTTSQDLQDAVTTGFLGGFTTFSALSMETILLVENGQILIATVYICASAIGGIIVGVLGYSLGGKMVGR